MKHRYWQMILALKDYEQNLNHENLIGITKDRVLLADRWQEDFVGAIQRRKITERVVVNISDDVQLVITDRLPKKLRKHILNYAWLCFPSAKMTTFVHAAQSVDGKIATLSGHSKWIGNEQNQVHAHRLRALSCAVLVGGKTFRSEKPQLTVRHVEGKNPIKVIITNEFCEIDKIYRASAEQIILITSNAAYSNCGFKDHVKVIYIEEAQSQIPTDVILDTLRKLGIKTLMIEGGTQTISNFIREDNIDILQLHIAPIVIGSGLAVMNLPEIDHLDEALQLTNCSYTKMGDAIMMTAQIKKE